MEIGYSALMTCAGVPYACIMHASKQATGCLAHDADDYSFQLIDLHVRWTLSRCEFLPPPVSADPPYYSRRLETIGTHLLTQTTANIHLVRIRLAIV